MVAIHNKNGKGLLHVDNESGLRNILSVAIHNKNGKGLLRQTCLLLFCSY